MVGQYIDTLEWSTEAEILGYDEYGQPIYSTSLVLNSIGRYESFTNGSFKQFVDETGETVFANGKYLVEYSQPLPNRFILAKTRDTIHKVLHVHKGQMNSIIYLIEQKTP